MTQPLPAPLDLGQVRADLEHASWIARQPNAGKSVELTRTLRTAEQLLAELTRIRTALVLEPCHVTGLHTPDHHPRWTCELQKAKAFDQVLDAAGLTADTMPRRLHAGCHWCHGTTDGPVDRELRRVSYAWAGLEIPVALAQGAAA